MWIVLNLLTVCWFDVRIRFAFFSYPFWFATVIFGFIKCNAKNKRRKRAPIQDAREYSKRRMKTKWYKFNKYNHIVPSSAQLRNRDTTINTHTAYTAKRLLYFQMEIQLNETKKAKQKILCNTFPIHVIHLFILGFKLEQLHSRMKNEMEEKRRQIE